jgi:hypothetical protein
MFPSTSMNDTLNLSCIASHRHSAWEGESTNIAGIRQELQMLFYMYNYSVSLIFGAYLDPIPSNKRNEMIC